MKDGVEAQSEISDADRRKIEGQILDDVLHANEHPSIQFRSTGVAEVPEGYRLEGVVRMHGMERNVVSVARRELTLLVSADELAARAAARPVIEPRAERGYRKLFLQSVTQADQGVDFDFLQPPQRTRRIPRG